MKVAEEGDVAKFKELLFKKKYLNFDGNLDITTGTISLSYKRLFLTSPSLLISNELFDCGVSLQQVAPRSLHIRQTKGKIGEIPLRHNRCSTYCMIIGISQWPRLGRQHGSSLCLS